MALINGFTPRKMPIGGVGKKVVISSIVHQTVIGDKDNRQILLRGLLQYPVEAVGVQ